MEPRRDDGDDRTASRYASGEMLAAMEPRRDDGDDRIYTVGTEIPSGEPQWSPVVTTGTTTG